MKKTPPPKPPLSLRVLPQHHCRTRDRSRAKFAPVIEGEEEQSPTSVAQGILHEGIKPPSDEHVVGCLKNRMNDSRMPPPPFSQQSATGVERVGDSKTLVGYERSKILVHNELSSGNNKQPIKSHRALPPRKPHSTDNRPCRISRTQSEPVLATAQDGASMYSLADDCIQRGDWNSALSVYEAVLHNQIEKYGPYHASVADACEKLGDLLAYLLKYERATKIFSETLQLKTDLFGHDNLQVATVLAKLGTCQVNLQQIDDAHRSFRNAIKLTIRHLGEDHEMVAMMQSQLACLYFSTGNYLAALGHFEDALGIYQSLVARCINKRKWLASASEALCNIGSVQLKRKRYQFAILSFSKALEMQREVFGLTHPLVVATLDNLAFSYSKKKEYSLGLETYHEMLQAQLSLKVYDIECYQTLTKLNVLYEKMGDLQGAFDLTRDAYALQCRTLEPQDEVLNKTRTTMDFLSELLRSTHLQDSKGAKSASARNGVNNNHVRK